jgi:hypothetical protein
VKTKSFGRSDLWVALREVALVKVRNFQGSGPVGTEGGSCFVSMPTVEEWLEPRDALSHFTFDVVLVVRLKFAILFDVIPFILVKRYQTFDRKSIFMSPTSLPSGK